MIWAALAMAVAVGGAREVSDLAWLAGAWREDRAGVSTRETWFGPTGGMMVSVTRASGSGHHETEFATLTREPAGLTFTAHVGGQPPTPFVLVRSGDGEAVFENKAHDFPQRVIYRRCGVQLCARIEGTVDGRLEGQDWTYTRER